MMVASRGEPTKDCSRFGNIHRFFPGSSMKGIEYYTFSFSVLITFLVGSTAPKEFLDRLMKQASIDEVRDIGIQLNFEIEKSCVD